MRGGANLPLVSSYNRSLVLDAVRTREGVSRVEIARLTGLTPQTVGNLVRRLLNDGLVVEAGQNRSTGGKPRTLLRLRPEARYAVGIHVDPQQTVYLLVDLAGSVVARSQDRRATDADADASVRRLAAGARQIVETSEVDSARVIGIGVAVPGPIDAAKGLVIAPPNLREWRDVPLGAALQSETGYPVLVDNDATAVAIGERWAGDAGGARNFACVYVGTGVGAGIFVDGQVYRGHTSNAGELGHISVDPAGPACHCGNSGCLELYCTPRAMTQHIRAARRRGQRSSVRLPTSPDALAALPVIVAAAESGDALALEAVERSSTHLAAAAVTLINLLDLELVLLCGPGLEGVGDRYVAAVRDALTHRALARSVQSVDVRLSGIGADAGALGAASLPLHLVFAPRLGGLGEAALTGARVPARTAEASA
jgi:predicted NBD/HSP70 family sugar kinase